MHHFLLVTSDYVGIFGVIIILVAYFLLSMGKWISNSMTYQILNFIGAWLILFSLFFHWNLASVIIEVAWIIISVIGMFRCVATREKRPSA